MRENTQKNDITQINKIGIYKTMCHRALLIYSKTPIYWL